MKNTMTSAEIADKLYMVKGITGDEVWLSKDYVNKILYGEIEELKKLIKLNYGKRAEFIIANPNEHKQSYLSRSLVLLESINQKLNEGGSR